MPREPFNPQRAAKALRRADETSARTAADELGVSIHTIHSWRRRLKTDPALRALYYELRLDETVAELETTWDQDLEKGLKRLVPTIVESTEKLAKDGKALAAVAAFKGLVDKWIEFKTAVADDEPDEPAS